MTDLNDKKITTLYLSSHLLAKAKSRNLNISELVNAFLSEYLSDEEQQQYEKLEEEISKLEKKLAKLRAMKRSVEEQLIKKQERKQKIDELFKLAKETSEIIQNEKYVTTEAEREKLRKERLRRLKKLKKALGLEEGAEDTIKFVKALTKGDLGTARRIIEERMSK